VNDTLLTLGFDFGNEIGLLAEYGISFEEHNIHIHQEI